VALKSTSSQYGRVAIAIHWSSAAAVILAWLAGFAVANAVPPTAGGALLLAHVALGLIVFALTLLRIVWWAVADRHPGAPAGQPRWQVLTAQGVHLLLYVLLVLMATSGIVTLVLSGALPALPVLLGGGAVPDFSELIPRVAHGIMSRILLALLVVHVGAALWHQLVKRDRLLARMGVGPAS
jgi:cytochrome b561